MTELVWDVVGDRLFETGVSLGVLYVPDANGSYTKGYAWDGLISVTESPSGAEATPVYASNKKYLNIISAEDFGGTIEAYTYPSEFLFHDGAYRYELGVAIHQQTRKSFGFSYVTIIGNDAEGNDFGYKLHLVWQALAAPSERVYTRVADSVEPLSFSWEFTTIPMDLTAARLKPTSHITIDSTKVDPKRLEELQDILYGVSGNPVLPPPEFIIDFMTQTGDAIDGGSPLFSSPDVIDGGSPFDDYIESDMIDAGSVAT